MAKTELEKLKMRYAKVCEKLEGLNEEAFELEKEIIFEMKKVK